MRSKISYTIELSTTRYFWPRYVLASLIPEPYWLRRLATSSESQGSGFGPSGFGGAAGLAAAGAAGLAAVGAAGVAAAGAAGFASAVGADFSPVVGAAAGFVSSAGFAAAGVSVLAAGVFACAEAWAETEGFSAGGVSPPAGGETGFGPLVSSGISVLRYPADSISSGTLSFSSLAHLASCARVTSHCDRNHNVIVVPQNTGGCAHGALKKIPIHIARCE